MNKKLPGEKICVGCGCWFIGDGDKCLSCAKLPETAGPKEKFIYQDVKRSDIDKKLTLILDKLNRILTLMGSKEASDKPKGYPKDCEMCGEKFIASAPATRYCDKCKDKKE